MLKHYIRTSLFFSAKWYSIVGYAFCLFIYHRYLNSFHFFLWIMLLWTVMCKCLCRQLLLFILAITQEMELLGHMVTPCSVFWETIRMFQKCAILGSSWPLSLQIDLLSHSLFFLFLVFEWHISFQIIPQFFDVLFIFHSIFSFHFSMERFQWQIFKLILFLVMSNLLINPSRVFFISI